MAGIEYKLSSNYLPIFATLRQNDEGGLIVDSKVLQESGVLETFNNISVGTYVVVGYDRASGSDSSGAILYSTTTIATIDKFTNTVYSILETSNGDYLVGGQFTGYSGTDAYGLIRLNPNDGTIDGAFTPPSGLTILSGLPAIFDLAEIVTGEYLIAGKFDTYNGEAHSYVTNVNASDGGFVGGWTPWTGATILNEYVNKIISVPTNKYLFMGAFTELNEDTDQKYITKTTTGGAFDGGFSTTPTGFNNVVLDSILTTGGTYVVVGAFTDYDGNTVGRIAVLNSDGSFNSAESSVFGAGFNQLVNSIVLTSTNQYLVCGGFYNYKGVASNRAILLNLDGTIDESFNIGTGFNSTVFKGIETSDNRFLFAGFFSTYNTLTKKYAVKLYPNGSVDVSFDTGTGFNTWIRTVTETTDGYYLFGGGFTTYKGNPHKHFIKLNQYGTEVW